MAVHTATDETRGSANSTFLCGCDIGDIGYGLAGGAVGALISAAGYPVMWAAISFACVASAVVYFLWACYGETSFSKQLASRG